MCVNCKFLYRFQSLTPFNHAANRMSIVYRELTCTLSLNFIMLLYNDMTIIKISLN